MEQVAIWEKLTAVFRDVLDEEGLVVRPETTARDVPGWDSLTHIQLLVAIERAFQIRFNTGEIAGLANVGEMVSLIGSKLADTPA